MNLVIVESPVKTKTIKSILETLGVHKDFDIIGTSGHVTNLDEKDLGVKLIDGKFEAEFKPIKEKEYVLDLIKKKLKYVNPKTDKIFICTDDDREGERIAEDIVHLCQIKDYLRVTFREITPVAIKKALIERDGVREIDYKISLAQWVRRIIDRVTGYGLSPAVKHYFQYNNKISYKDETGETKQLLPKGVGRVLSLALNVIAKRQKLIDNYDEVGATITDVVLANYKYADIGFSAIASKLEFTKEESTKRAEIINSLNYKIHRVYSKSREIAPEPPPSALITQSLLTSASFLYELSPKKTTSIAKDLYEMGYINYPRTDTINLSDSVANRIIEYLLATVEESKHSDILLKPRVYKAKKENVQNAHEAIRPSIFAKTEDITISEIKEYSPDNIKNVWAKNPMTKDFDEHHFLIYELIWIRAICTQFKNAEYDVSKIEIKAGEYTFEAKSNDRVYDGWEQYQGDLIKNSTYTGEDVIKKRVVIPSSLSVNTIIEEAEVTFYEKKSKSPKRISEGGLINMLSNLNVARPSTLHTYSSLLVDKEYAKSLKTYLVPTDLGMELNSFTESHLEWLIDEKKAKEFEKTITKIETGKITEVNSLIKYYWDLVNEFREQVGYQLLTETKSKSNKSVED